MTRKQLSLMLTGAIVSAVLAFSPMHIVTPATAAAATAEAPARWIGFYQPGAPQDVTPLASLEGKLGVHVKVTNFFRSVEQPFSDDDVENVFNRGSIPLITLEICGECKSSDVTQSDYTLASIVSGSHDTVLRKYARAARDAGHEIWIRPLHEMNGNWYPWGGTVNGNHGPAEFKQAWQRVHDIFVQEGATNVKFVWCPNIESVPNTAANSIPAYYPGDGYVDYMAIDVYNAGTTQWWSKWRSFSSLFGPTYKILCENCSATKPIFIAETASVSNGGNKAAWIAEMFRVIPVSFPRVVGVSWFNSANNRQDWPVDSSSTSLQQFRLGVANGSYSPGLQLARVHTGISAKPSAKSVRRRHKIKLSGVLTPGQYHDRLRVTLTVPKHRGSHRDVLTNGSAGWSMNYTPTVRGTYYARVTYAGDSTRLGGASKTFKFVVK